MEPQPSARRRTAPEESPAGILARINAREQEIERACSRRARRPPGGSGRRSAAQRPRRRPGGGRREPAAGARVAEARRGAGRSWPPRRARRPPCGRRRGAEQAAARRCSRCCSPRCRGGAGRDRPDGARADLRADANCSTRRPACSTSWGAPPRAAPRLGRSRVRACATAGRRTATASEERVELEALYEKVRKSLILLPHAEAGERAAGSRGRRRRCSRRGDAPATSTSSSSASRRSPERRKEAADRLALLAQVPEDGPRRSCRWWSGPGTPRTSRWSASRSRASTRGSWRCSRRS